VPLLCSHPLPGLIRALNIQRQMVSPPSECCEFLRCMSDNDDFCCEEVILIITGEVVGEGCRGRERWLAQWNAEHFHTCETDRSSPVLSVRSEVA
jgi:hypothetical protein